MYVVAQAYILQESCNITAPSFVDHVVQISGDSWEEFTDTNRGGAGADLMGAVQPQHGTRVDRVLCLCDQGDHLK